MKNTPKLLAVMFSGCMLFAAAGPLQAGKVYKWVDEEGITHYTERKPDRSGEVQELGVSGTTTPTADSAQPPPVTGTAPAGEAGGGAAEEEGVPPDLDVREKKINEVVRKHNCQKARAQLKVLNENARVREKNEKGEYVFLDEKQMEERKAKMRQAVEDNCN